MHGSDIDFKRDSDEVKGWNQRGCLCTARLDSIYRVILQHNKGIQWTTCQFLVDTILELARCDSYFWRVYRPPCLHIPLHKQLQVRIILWNFDTA